MNHRGGIASVIQALCLVLGASPLWAVTIPVTTNGDELNADGDCSLREAVEAANTDGVVDACGAGSGTDLIRVPPDTYTLTVGTSLALDGDLTIEPSSAGAVIVQASATIGTATDRVFLVDTGANVTLRGLEVRNGVGATDGGGIRSDGTLTLEDCTVRDNRLAPRADRTDGSHGAGIASFGALTLTRTVVRDNLASIGTLFGGHGGGVFMNGGPLTMSQSQILGNGTSGWAGDGGGLYLNGPATIEDSLVQGNTTGDVVGTASAGYGGGLMYFGSSLTVRRSTIAGNATGDTQDFSYGGLGGGLYLAGPTVLENTTISGNRTGSAAGAGSQGGNGGGFSTQTGQVLVRYSTIVGNSTGSGETAGGSGGGIQINDPDQGDPIPRIEATVIFGNTVAAGGVGADVRGTFESGGYNLFGTTAGMVISGDTLSNQVGNNPQLGTLSANGGFTPTHLPAITSPLVDEIPPGTIGCGTTLIEDQRGILRPQGTQCDIGSVEVEGGGPVSVVEVPALDKRGVAALATLLAFAAGILLRRR